MLRITEKKRKGPKLVLEIEGTIDDRGVEEVYSVCARAVNNGLDAQLDLSGVRFVSRSAVERFRSLRDLPVDMVNCSPFLAEQLKLEGCDA